MEHSVSKGNNQGTKKNGIPAALKRGQNTKTMTFKMDGVVNKHFTEEKIRKLAELATPEDHDRSKVLILCFFFLCAFFLKKNMLKT